MSCYNKKIHGSLTLCKEHGAKVVMRIRDRNTISSLKLQLDNNHHNSDILLLGCNAKLSLHSICFVIMTYKMLLELKK